MTLIISGIIVIAKLQQSQTLYGVQKFIAN